MRIVSACSACAALIVYGASTAVAGSTTSTFTTTTLNPAYYGSTIELIASVTTASGAAVTTGSVTFYNGNADLGSVALDSSGYAVLTLSNLPVGSYDISAVFNGTAAYNPSASATFVESVQLNPTWVVLSASQASPPYGADETFTAQIGTGTGTGATPTGTMTFLDGSATIASVAVSGWSVSATVDTLPLGSNSITASYSGNQGFEPSTSPVTSVTVGQATASIALSSSPASPTWGSPVTITAAASAQGSVLPPTGSVSFTLDGSAAGTATLSGTGSASLTLPASLAVGSHAIGASYAGNADFTAATASGISVNVAHASTGTALTASTASATVGTAVTFTASVQPTLDSTPPSGTVTFYDGTSILGTAAVTSQATASLTTAALAVGTHAITAKYSGDASYAGSTSSAYTETTTLIPTTVSLSASPSTSAYGTPISLSAHVQGSGGAAVTTGTVTFSSGSTALGSGTVGTSGSATLTLSGLAAGSYSITAAYSGSGVDGSASSSALTIAVTKIATGTSLSLSATSGTYGTIISASASVTDASGAAVPSGSVTFADGTTVLGSASLNTQGTATLSLGTLAVGQHSITATFSGNANDAASVSAATGVSIAQAPTSLSLTPSGSTVQLGNSVSFTASLTAGVNVPAPTGTVTFADGTTNLGTASLSRGSATFSTAALAAGVHGITATYSGDATYGGSTSATVDVTVEAAATTTSLTDSPSAPIYGESVTLTASVSGSQAGFPISGTVSFLDGSAVLGTSDLTSQGTATLTVNSLALGSHLLSAQYNGAKDYLASSSAQTTLTVGIADTATALAASSATEPFGSAVTFTATVTSPYAAPTGGSVTFSEGSTALGTVTLGANGTASLTTTALGVGSYTISASFSGVPDFAASSSAGVAFSVSKDASSTALSVTPQGGTYGTSVTITANVTAADTPTGTVTFTDGSATLATVQLSSNGASYTFVPAEGSHSFGAVYSGDGSTSGSTAAVVADTIGAATPGVSLAISPEPALVNEQVVATASLALPNGATAAPSGTFAFAVNGTPIASCAAVALSNGVAQCTGVLPVGTDSITATYSGDTTYTSASASGSDTVEEVPTSVALTSAQQSLQPNVQDTLTAVVTPSVTSLGTPAGTVSFSANGTAIQGCVNVALVSGSSTCSYTAGSPGTVALTAAYSGNGEFLASSGSISLQVGSNRCDLPGRGWHFGEFEHLFDHSDCGSQPGRCDLPHIWQCIDYWIHVALHDGHFNNGDHGSERDNADFNRSSGIHFRSTR